jgi:hypothetical protein
VLERATPPRTAVMVLVSSSLLRFSIFIAVLQKV